MLCHFFQFKMSRFSLVNLLTDVYFSSETYGTWQKKLVVTMAKEKHERIFNSSCPRSRLTAFQSKWMETVELSKVFLDASITSTDEELYDLHLSMRPHLKRLPTGFVYVTPSHRDKLWEEFRAVSMEKHVKVYDMLIDMLERLAVIVDNKGEVLFESLTFLILRNLPSEFAEFKLSPLLAVEKITMNHLMEKVLLFGLEYDEKVTLEPKIPNLNAKRVKEKKRPRCWNCGEVGHLKRDCIQSSVSSS